MYDGTLNVQDLSARDFRDLQRQLRRGERRGLYSNAEEQKEYYQDPRRYISPTPLESHYSGPAALTQDQLSATTFKQGGKIISYAQYLRK